MPLITLTNCSGGGCHYSTEKRVIQKPSWLWDGWEAKSWWTAAGQTSAVVTVNATTMTHRLTTTCQLASTWKLNWFAAFHSRPLIQLIFTPHAKRSVSHLVFWHTQLEHGTLEEHIIIIILPASRRTADVIYVVSQVKCYKASCLCEWYLMLKQAVHSIGILRKQTKLTHAVCSENYTNNNKQVLYEISMSVYRERNISCILVVYITMEADRLEVGWKHLYLGWCLTVIYVHYYILHYTPHVTQPAFGDIQKAKLLLVTSLNIWTLIEQELSYRKQIARQLHTQYVEGI